MATLCPAPQPSISSPETAPKRRAVIWDLDGTLNICEQTSKFDWCKTAECERIMANHAPEPRMVKLINSLYNYFTFGGPTLFFEDVRFFIVTGRPAKFFGVTRDWLVEHEIQYDHILMRPDGDDRSDSEVKRQLLQEIQKDYTVWFAVEDRKSVVEMWRQEGILCLQCAEGNY